MKLEKRLVSRFKQRSIPFHDSHMRDDWEWLFLMQHYSAPTRLLDWSESPLMALFFAVTSSAHILGAGSIPKFKYDATVWMLSPTLWNIKAVDLNLKRYSGDILSTDEPNAKAYEPFVDVNMMKTIPIALYGAHNSQRIVAQRGVFVCFGKDTRPMEKIYQTGRFPANSLLKLIIRKKRLPAFHTALMNLNLPAGVDIEIKM